MSSSTCGFKKDTRKYMNKCKYGCECMDFSKEHRQRFYHVCRYDTRCFNLKYEHRNVCPHSAFGELNENRLDFLLRIAKYSLSKKEESNTFNPQYLWEQFSCDFNLEPEKELHRKFLITCYNRVEQIYNQLTTLSSSVSSKETKEYELELMIINQAIFTLEQEAITGIYYLNQAFLMWVFQKSSIEDLNDFLTKTIGIDALYGLHFKKILDIIKISKKLTNNKIQEVVDSLDVIGLKQLYANFMLSDDLVSDSKSKKRSRNTENDLEKIREQEVQIILFQKTIRDFPSSTRKTLDETNYQRNDSSDMIQILNISNTGLNNIIEKILVSRGISKDNWITNFFY